ncbi:MAG TPA: VWA domain-containing protein [Bryobacteraceae bacterium]|nr:VWA domain-containing protein [Bryobacteraceae bacterium]
MHILPRLSMASMALAACAWAAPRQPYVDSSQADLIKAAPELSALSFDSDQSTLDALLRTAGEQLESVFAKAVNLSMAEEVHETRFDSAHLMWKEHRDRFRYVLQARPFAESRRQTQGPDAAQPNARSAFLIAGPFVEMLGDVLPENQEQARFRYLGRITEGGRPSLVVAFIEKDGTREGLVWLDEATKRILRFRTDVLNHPNGGKFDSFTRDVRFVPVNFSALATTLWLPSRATVHARFATGEAHTIHRFSDYRADKNNDIGKADGPTGMEDDAFEMLLKGVAALEAGKPEYAVAPLRAAAGQLPERVEPGYYLGLACHETHDWAGAETQFRETVKRAPNLAAAHDGLGAVLLKRGDQPGAVAELQEALRLEPGNVKIRANLDAATRSPADQRVAKDAPTAGEVTIKVDVRQVLVPVVVTDKQGHHVTGLAQTDFKVFEDGVEQKITAFSSERADVTTPAAPAISKAEPVQPTPAAVESPKPLPARHTYVICLDTVHTSFADSVHVRGALQKLFQQEEAGDSRYVVIALGRSMELIQDATSDPAKVLETLDGPMFRNLFLRGPNGSAQFDVSGFEQDLQRVRAACDAHEPACQIEKQALPPQTDAYAERERSRTTDFLAQLRSVVEQLGRDSGRRTMVLISDGILLAPGRIPFGLLEAYFPEFRSTRKFESMHDVMEPIFRQAVKANVTIYTIDSRGLYTSSGMDASRGGYVREVAREWDDIATDEGLTLSEIAAATGGTAFKNSNDLFTGLQRAFADGREYYTLAYVSTNEAQDGKFRKIAVQVRDKKAVVNAKRGYWSAAQ